MKRKKLRALLWSSLNGRILSRCGNYYANLKLYVDGIIDELCFDDDGNVIEDDYEVSGLDMKNHNPFVIKF